MSGKFVAFSKIAGQRSSTARPEFGFPGLKPGERWCVCGPRWQETLMAGQAPPVYCALRACGSAGR
ncbi:MAG: DUF2237 family protein [Acetobacteraceae bacterium]|nr:DUF2237 family protein [Acetobacteraceae bacterium]